MLKIQNKAWGSENFVSPHAFFSVIRGHSVRWPALHGIKLALFLANELARSTLDFINNQKWIIFRIYVHTYCAVSGFVTENELKLTTRK